MSGGSESRWRARESLEPHLTELHHARLVMLLEQGLAARETPLRIAAVHRRFAIELAAKVIAVGQNSRRGQCAVAGARLRGARSGHAEIVVDAARVIPGDVGIALDLRRLAEALESNRQAGDFVLVVLVLLLGLDSHFEDEDEGRERARPKRLSD
ncbi:MAG: hypothetical protein HYY24_10405 [Verrucomicrobia bacterium]|nr:hypothetical protein [Verrucomicrobiota bacterium]